MTSAIKEHNEYNIVLLIIFILLFHTSYAYPDKLLITHFIKNKIICIQYFDIYADSKDNKLIPIIEPDQDGYINYYINKDDLKEHIYDGYVVLDYAIILKPKDDIISYFKEFKQKDNININKIDELGYNITDISGHYIFYKNDLIGKDNICSNCKNGKCYFNYNELRNECMESEKSKNDCSFVKKYGLGILIEKQTRHPIITKETVRGEANISISYTGFNEVIPQISYQLNINELMFSIFNPFISLGYGLTPIEYVNNTYMKNEKYFLGFGINIVKAISMSVGSTVYRKEFTGEFVPQIFVGISGQILGDMFKLKYKTDPLLGNLSIDKKE